MDWKIGENKNKGSSNIFLRMFYLFSVTLLSLLFPISFILLSRLSSAHYFLSLASNPPPKSFLHSLFLYKNPNLLHGLVSIVTLAALINALMGRVGPLRELPGPVFRPCVHGAWMFLCTFQLCVALCIDVTVKEGFYGGGFGEGRSMGTKVLFFVGLYETMIHWARMIVRPVVDNTVFGGPREERRVERLALAVGFIPWWMLRDEVDALVGVVLVKRDMRMGVGFGDFLGWWLYYFTVVIAILKIMKGLMWLIMVPFCWSQIDEDYAIDIKEGEDKV